MRTRQSTTTATSTIQRPSSRAVRQHTTLPSSAITTQSQTYHDEDGSNICVVARSRGRNEREVKLKSAVVVDTNSESRTDISVRVGSDLASNKTYTVDRVFGPEADQSMIFEEIISPIVDDLLRGMNCTVFAYGQTGTGKTYTMSGDDSICEDMFAHDAGVIPRVLYRLFSTLDMKDADFTVSCTFVELYNEELRDLLASDDGKKVRIFDDAAKKSVIVQGLQDFYISSAVGGLKVLQSGHRKRHVASTNMNDRSSRSHTIFTLNVTIEIPGEECLRSKINLVDLAGSENIGKSGAENKRAREAGMINQSLLTLGRVINSLVDKSPHVPYRESKLTRLLQDSLGGRTKTCIIATVSPALNNVEETLSTLEYASRAKNIKNKPQLNSSIPKKRLMKEYAEELEKMQHDLHATRKKNGIYLDNDNYNELMADKESQNILVKDQQRKLTTVDEQLRSVRELVELTKKQLKEVNLELESSSKDLTLSISDLNQTGQQLNASRIQLISETGFYRQNGMANHLNSSGKELVTTLDQTIDDVNGLLQKLQEKRYLESKTRAVTLENTDTLNGYVGNVSRQIQNYSKVHSQTFEAFSGKLEQFRAIEYAQIQAASTLIHQNFDALKYSREQFQQSSSDTRSNMTSMASEVESLKQDVKGKIAEQLRTLGSSVAYLPESIQDALAKHEEFIQLELSSLSKHFDNTWAAAKQEFQATTEKLESIQHKLLSQVSNFAHECELTIKFLKDRLAHEHDDSAAKRKALVSQISRLIEDYAQDDECRIDEAVSRTRVPSSKPVIQEHEALGKAINMFSLETAEGTRALFDQQMVNAQAAVKSQNAEILQVAQDFKASASADVADQISSVDDSVIALDAFLGVIGSTNQKHGEAVNTQVSAICDNYQNVLEHMMANLEVIGTELTTYCNGAMSPDAQKSWIETHKFTQASLDKMSRAVNTIAALSRGEPAGSNLSPMKKRRLSTSSSSNYRPPHSIPKLDDDDDSRIPLNEIAYAENRPVTTLGTLEKPAKVIASAPTQNTRGIKRLRSRNNE